jgi:hypothetical protein
MQVTRSPNVSVRGGPTLFRVVVRLTSNAVTAKTIRKRERVASCQLRVDSIRQRLLALSEAFIAATLPAPPPSAQRVAAWTDHYSNVFQILE